MHKMMRMATICLSLMLAACAGPLFRQAPALGDPAAAVTAKMGQPTAIYPVPDGQLFEYATGPMGQATWMAQFGPDGRLASWKQVLTSEKFATIRIGKATKDEVLRTIGQPAEHSRVASHDFEVWSYRYKEADVWNSMMHVHFDRNGIVQQMLNGPDPREVRERPSF